MLARIYQPARSAMQSGPARHRDWVLEFVPADAKVLDPLMGWTGSGDMNRQVRLRFESREAAVAYAERHGIAYQVFEPKRRGARAAAERLRRQLRGRSGASRLDALSRPLSSTG